MSFKKILYAAIAGLLLVVSLTLAAPEASAADAAWRAQYYNNKNLSGAPALERDEVELSWDWGYGSPSSKVYHDGFSARWTRTVNFSTGNYRFSASMDDGMRVWVDDVLIIDSWQNGSLRTISADRHLSGGDHRIRVEYYEDGFMAYAKLTWAPTSPATINNWHGEYYNNEILSGSPVLVRDDANVDFNWGTGSPAANIVSSDHFSARWTRSLIFQPGRHRFTARVDDGVRLWVNNQLIIDKWLPQSVQSHSGEIELPGGPASVRMEYFERTGFAEAHLSWQRLTTPPVGGGLGTATVTEAYFLNVRSGPGLSYNVVGTAARNEVLNLLGYRNAEGNWIMVARANGTQGWIHAGYVSTSIPVSSLMIWTGQPGSPGQTSNATVNTGNLNVRSGPGVGHNVIAVIAHGTPVNITHRNAASTWVRIVLPSGAQGWVNAGYLSTSISIGSLPIG